MPALSRCLLLVSRATLPAKAKFVMQAGSIAAPSPPHAGGRSGQAGHGGGGGGRKGRGSGAAAAAAGRGYI